MDISSNDLAFLQNSIYSNNLVLFLGAGFSASATNHAGNLLPVGSQFAVTLWQALKYSGDYDGTDLQTLYEAAVRRLNLAQLRGLLNETFICKKVPDWYRAIGQIFWYRIYTTNVDNLVEFIYNFDTSIQKLQIRNALFQDFIERDQFLDTLQYIKLNGSIINEQEPEKTITFSTTQYADRMNQKEPWYDHFVRDYSIHPTVFIGSQLNEPLLFQAIEAR